MSDSQPAEEPIDVPGRKLTERDKFYLELAYKEPVESIGRIEDTAKFVAGAVIGSSGLLMSALRITMSVNGDQTLSMTPWFVVLAFWFVSLLMLFGVLFPLPWYPRKDNPASWEATYRSIRNIKYFLLGFGTLLFLSGVLAGFVALNTPQS